MSDTLTESVARLHRAGSEHSQQTKKLRAAVDELIDWLNKNIPFGFKLPCNVKIYPSNELSILNGAYIFRRGEEHTVNQLHYFANLIGTEGFLDKLSEVLETQSVGYQFITDKIGSFLTNP